LQQSEDLQTKERSMKKKIFYIINLLFVIVLQIQSQDKLLILQGIWECPINLDSEQRFKINKEIKSLGISHANNFDINFYL